MRVPRPRLLVWFALVVVPFAGLAGLPGALHLSLAAIGGFLILVLLDFARSRTLLKDLSLELPDVIRATRDRPGEMEVRLRNPGMKAMKLRVGFPFPQGIQATHEDRVVFLPEGHEFSRIPWTWVGTRRGSYPLHHGHLETTSPMGFWATRRVVPLQTDIRVYPNLSVERRNLAGIFLNRGLMGVHAHRQVGQGKEFEKLREYVRGDSFGDIHWKATAKRGYPITKEYQIERTQEIYVVLDASRLSARRPSGLESARPEPDQSVLERCITATLVMGLVAQRQGDLFGLLTFSDKIQGFVRAAAGTAHFSACRDSLLALEPREVNPDFEEMATFIRLRMRRRSLLVILTSLDDPMLAESFTRAVQLICRQHVLLVNMLTPTSARPLFTGPEIRTEEEIYGALSGHVLWRNLRELDRVLHQKGIRFSLLDNEKMCPELVSQYISVKRRQIL